MTNQNANGEWYIGLGRMEDGKPCISPAYNPMRYIGPAIDKLAKYENLLDLNINVHLPEKKE